MEIEYLSLKRTHHQTVYPFSLHASKFPLATFLRAPGKYQADRGRADKKMEIRQVSKEDSGV